MWIILYFSYFCFSFKPYEQFSRNFKFIADFSKGKERLWVGSESIINIFEALPKTEHDSSTFTIDLLTYTVNKAEFIYKINIMFIILLDAKYIYAIFRRN